MLDQTKGNLLIPGSIMWTWLFCSVLSINNVLFIPLSTKKRKKILQSANFISTSLQAGFILACDFDNINYIGSVYQNTCISRQTWTGLRVGQTGTR